MTGTPGTPGYVPPSNGYGSGKAIGIGVGVPAALMLTRVVKSQLYGLEAHDPWTLGLATGLLAVVACAAGYVPALRASRVDPMKALRYE